MSCSPLSLPEQTDGWLEPKPAYQQQTSQPAMRALRGTTKPAASETIVVLGFHHIRQASQTNIV